MRAPPDLLACLAVILVSTFLPLPAAAQWRQDGIAVSSAANGQQLPAIVADGAGGAIVAWKDGRSGGFHIYVQRIDSWGVPLWTPDGVALSATLSDFAAIASDGAGGAIVSWQDVRSGNYDVYAQRIDASGAVQWTGGGKPVCTASSHQTSPAIVSDGAGGAIVAWRDLRSGDYDVYAQRIDASGAVQWAASGAVLCSDASDQWSIAVVSDGAEGAVVAWCDARSGDFDVYAQKIDASGAVPWTTDGVTLCAAADDQESTSIASDGAGGAIVTWQDARSVTYDIYAQRVDASGAVQWAADGEVVCAAAYHQFSPELVSDAAAGAVVTWRDLRSGNYDIYVQRINELGDAQWTESGEPLCTDASHQWSPTLVRRGAGGAVVTWHDSRSGTLDIYAQRIDASGAVQWTTNGVALCTATDDQDTPAIASDGAGGAVVAWQDARTGIYDIYAQRVWESGVTSVEVAESPVTSKVGEVTPNPFAGTASLTLDLPAPSPVRLDVYDVAGRAVWAAVSAGAAGLNRIEWNGRDRNGRLLTSGVYFCRVTAAGETTTRKMVVAR